MFYYPFNVGDYLSHTAHLNEAEDLAYRRMLDWCYMHEKALPENPEEVARLIRMRSHSDTIAEVLQEFFELQEEGWIQQRIIDEIRRYKEKGEKAAQSARKRWKAPEADKVKDEAKPVPSQCVRNAKQNQEPITNNQITILPETPSGISFDRFWELYPKKVAKEAAAKLWKRLNVSEEVFTSIQSHLSKAYIGTDKQFIPNASTYLNQKRWQDEILQAPALPAQASFMETRTDRSWADDFMAKHTDRSWRDGLTD